MQWTCWGGDLMEHNPSIQVEAMTTEFLLVLAAIKKDMYFSLPTCFIPTMLMLPAEEASPIREDTPIQGAPPDRLPPPPPQPIPYEPHPNQPPPLTMACTGAKSPT
jgi:hypothetical protein